MLLTSQRPGVHTFESTYGPIPVEQIAFQDMHLVGPARRGPVDEHRLITSPTGFQKLYGRPWTGTYLDDAVRAIFEIIATKCWIRRVANDDAVKATKTLLGGGTSQVETATVVGTITGDGNAAVIVTAAGMTGSPKTINVAVLTGDTASVVAGKIRTALAADADVIALFAVSGTGATVVLTRLVHAANDATLNISIDNGTCTGLTTAATSANTTAGVADSVVLTITAKGPGEDYNYSAGPPKAGVALTYDADNEILRVFDYSDPISPTRAQEIFYDVNFSRAAQVVEEINSSSNLIDVAWTLTTANPITVTADQGLAGGDDGTAVTSAEVIGNEVAGTGVYSFLDPSLSPGFLLCPGFPQETVGLAMLDVAQRNRKLACIDSTFGLGANVQDLIAEKQQYAAPQGHAVYCAQWVRATDLENPGSTKDVPRSPYVAAHIAKSHGFPGSIANVGAGTRFVYPNVTALEFDFNDLDHDELNRNNVNIARNFARKNRGIVSFSARTVSGNILYRFVSVRIIFDVMARSIEDTLIDYVFEPIDGQNRLALRIKASIEQFLNTLWTEGVLFGATAADAFAVVANTDNLSLIDQGILSFDVYAKPTPPAERIMVTFYRTALTVNLRNKTVNLADQAAA